MFSAAVRFGRSLKSWNTQPRFRRSSGTFERFSRPRSRPPTMMRPPVGSTSFSRRRMSVDLPEPDAPTTKTNSPLSMTKETPSSAVTWFVSYTFLTSSNTIIAAPLGPSAAGCSSTLVSGSARAVMSLCEGSSVTGRQLTQPARAAPARLRTLQCSRRFPCTLPPAQNGIRERGSRSRRPLKPSASRPGAIDPHRLDHLTCSLGEEIGVHSARRRTESASADPVRADP